MEFLNIGDIYTMKAKYIDSFGEIDTTVTYTGKKLTIQLNDYEFTSKFLGEFRLSETHQMADSRFRFNPFGELTEYTLWLEIPVGISIDSVISRTSLQCGESSNIFFNK